MKKYSRIVVFGATGLVGSAVVRMLRKQGYKNILTPSHKHLNLLNYDEVAEYFSNCYEFRKTIQYVFLCAAKAGGIIANSTYPADYIYENIQIQTNIIKASHDWGVKKFLFLGSSCIYPKLAPQPMKEESLMTGALEYTNEAYAVAKIAGIMMCKKFKEQYGDNFISVMPCNLYGPNDNFNLETSHVIPAMINKFVDAKIRDLPEVSMWGDGTPTREFLYVDDLAEALILVMNNYDGLDFINIGSGEEIAIKNLAYLIAQLTGYEGKVVFDPSKPNGTPRKVLDVSKIKALGWKPSIDLAVGINKLIQWYYEYKSQV